MKIGLDFGGVIDAAPDKWIELINNSNHEFFLVSHCIADWDFKMRQDFSALCKITDLTFIHDPNDEVYVQKLKGDLVRQHGIELFIDDYKERADAVREANPNCVCLAIPPERVQEGIDYIKNL